MNLTNLELDTIYFYLIKLGHFTPTAFTVGGCYGGQVKNKISIEDSAPKKKKSWVYYKNVPPPKFLYMPLKPTFVFPTTCDASMAEDTNTKPGKLCMMLISIPRYSLRRIYQYNSDFYHSLKQQDP